MNASSNPPAPRADLWWRCAVGALLVLVALAWWPALSASFQFDDWNVIVHDPHVQSFAAWFAAMPGIRPVLKFSYALNNSLSGAAGSSAFGFRCVNVLIHGCNVLLAALLLRRRDAAAALIAAVIFALHPLQTEAVTYISGRSVALAALFSLLSLYAWLRARDAAAVAPGSTTPRMWRAIAVASLLLALGSKETAVVVPLLLWLWLATEPGAARVEWRELRWFALGAASLLALALLWAPYRHLLATDLATRPLLLNLLTQAHALFYLLGQWLWPLHLNADPQLVAITSPDAWSCALSLLWLAGAAVALWQRRRQPQFAFGVLWFLICLLPTNSLLPRPDVANDRQLYLALLGPTWCLSVALVRALQLQLPARRRWLYGVAACAALVLGCATLQRNRVYADEIAFWEDVVQQSPSNARAFNNLGMAYALACRDAEAATQFRRSMALQPQEFRARVNLQLLQTGRLFDPLGRKCDAGARQPNTAN